MEQVTIIGGGAGGCAAAVELVRKGVSVSLFSRTADRMKTVAENGGLSYLMDGVRGFAPVRIVSEIADACKSEALFVFTVANAHASVAKLFAPHIRPNHVVVLFSGSGGTLEIAKIWRGLGVARLPLLGETVTLPLSGRMVDSAEVAVMLPTRMRTAAFPASNTPSLIQRVGGLFQMIPGRNVLDTALNNPNFIFHPAPMILNYAEIERKNGALSLMNEGYTEAVLRMMDAHDREKMALAAALGIEPISLDDLYREFGRSPDLYRLPGEVLGIRDRIHARYLDEDVPYGTVFMSSLGRLLAIPTPINDAITTLASIIREVNFFSIGRTVDRLGVAGLNARQLSRYLDDGIL